MSLNPKQAQFVREYLIDLNATQAAIRAGYSSATAKQQGARLLTHADVRAAVEKGAAKRVERTEITADRVLNELAKLAFSDIRKVVSWQANVTGMVEGEDGEQRLAVTNQVQLVDSDKVDDMTAAAIAEVSQTATGALKVKLYDKKGALETLARHLGLLKDKVELTDPDGNNPFAPLMELIAQGGRPKPSS